MKFYTDIAIIGAGSIGTTLALVLSEEFKIIVIDKNYSPGQGQNKMAIGGIRASHSNKAKIFLAKESLKFYKNWKNLYNFDILWQKSGYLYLAYNKKIDQHIRSLTKYLNKNKVKAFYLDKNQTKELIRYINVEKLISSMYTPDDATASPLLAINSFYLKAKENKTNFIFNEKVIDIKYENNIFQIKTDKSTKIFSTYLINASGANAKEIGKLLNIKLAVEPESHEAGITEPIKKLFNPLIVDLQSDNYSANIYFYQNTYGQLIFSLTPKKAIKGKDTRPTSSFLPVISKRIIKIMPILMNIRIRRTWRGLYPMTPDSNPIISKDKNYPNLIHTIGLCGQGFMLAPGIAFLIKRLLLDKLTAEDNYILNTLSLYRKFKEEEILK